MGKAAVDQRNYKAAANCKQYILKLYLKLPTVNFLRH